jgi:predicted NBD/HSP70 family sugar kinase
MGELQGVMRWLPRGDRRKMVKLRDMPNPSTGELSEILTLLRTRSELTRADVAEITGWGRSTIAARLDQLQAAGLVIESGEAASTGGRPPAVFAFAPGSRIVVAVDLGITHARVAVTDLAGQVLASRQEQIQITDGPDEVLGRVSAMAAQLVDEAGRCTADIAGIGIGLPGPVDHATGRPTNPPIMPGWDGADVSGRLRKVLGPTPIRVDNDVNVMALGEHAVVYPEIDNLVFLKVGTGIGAGFISGGRLLRGAEGVAGDIGHIAVLNDLVTPCRCGNTGCLRDFSAIGMEVHSNADVVAIVRSGNAEASRMMRSAGRHIGQVLAACVSMLNPSVIVIGGKLVESGEHLVAGIREAVYGRSLPLATSNLRIHSSQTGVNAGVLGAASMVIDYVLSAEGFKSLL